jgi:hypothetical protein
METRDRSTLVSLAQQVTCKLEEPFDVIQKKKKMYSLGDQAFTMQSSINYWLDLFLSIHFHRKTLKTNDEIEPIKKST